jgi:hypothetical protein
METENEVTRVINHTRRKVNLLRSVALLLPASYTYDFEETTAVGPQFVDGLLRMCFNPFKDVRFKNVPHTPTFATYEAVARAYNRVLLEETDTGDWVFSHNATQRGS